MLRKVTLPEQTLGQLEFVDDGLVIGWVWMPPMGEDKAAVELIVDGYSIALGRANVFRSELLAQYPGDGCYGFQFRVDPALLYKATDVRVRVANTEVYFDAALINNGHQQNINRRRLAGEVFLDYGIGLKGWCWKDGEEKRIDEDRDRVITVFEHGKVVESTSFQWVSLQSLGIPDDTLGGKQQRIGFNLSLPLALADGKVHRLEVRNWHDEPLDGSPLQFCSYPEGLGAVLNEQQPQVPDYLIQSVEALEARSRGGLDFALYPQWYARYGQPAEPVDVAEEHIARGLLLIHGDGDVDKTFASLSPRHRQLMTALVLNRPTKASKVRGKSSTLRFKAGQLQHCSTLELIDYLDESGESKWLLPIHAGDTVLNQTISRYAQALCVDSAEIAYGDVDYEDQTGQPTAPWFKPDWDYDLFLSGKLLASGVAFHAYILDTAVIRSFPVQDWAAVAVTHLAEPFKRRAIEQSQSLMKLIRHIPEVLVRHASAQVASDLISATAISTHIKKVGLKAKLTEAGSTQSSHRVHWHLMKRNPTVSILIPTRDQPELLAACLESLTRTNYKNYHVIVIDNQSVDPKTQQVLRKYRNLIRQVIPYPHRFNYAGINNLAAEVATGEYLCFMNNDVEASDADWLNEMVSHLQREDVGAVGAKLLWPNGMVQHAGVVLGLHGLAGHQGNLWYQQDAGYAGYNQVTREVSAVTAACMLVRRQDFLAVGGFDAINFPVAFNDVDLCLKLRKAGYRILWTPHAELIHHESVSRGADDHPAKIARLEKEIRALRNRWGEALLHDPYYNRNLSLRHFSHAGLACPPRPVPANSTQRSGLI